MVKKTINTIKQNYISIIFIMILIIYIPILLVLSKNIGLATFLNADQGGYLETIRKIHIGLYKFDLKYAFDVNTYAYGFGHFLILSLITFPFYVFKLPEQYTIFTIRFFSLAMFLLSLIMLKYIIKKFCKSRNITFNKYLFVIQIAVILLFPATHFMLTRIHPEMLQTFLLTAAIYFLWEYDDSRKLKYGIFSAFFFGYAIAAKISSVIFLIVPLVYYGFVFLKNFHENRGYFIYEFKNSIIFMSIIFATSMLFTYPLIVLDFKEGIKIFLSQYQFFSKTLKINALADFDFFKELSSNKEILFSWVTYVYNHGFINCFAQYFLVIIMIYSSYKEYRNKNKFPLSIFILVLYLITSIYYMTTVTRISTYYFFPIMFVFVPIALINIQVYFNGKVKVLIFNIIVIIALFNTVHDFKIIKEHFERGLLAQKNQYKFDGVTKLIRENSFPRNKILFSTQIPLNISSEEMEYVPLISSRDEINCSINSTINFLPYNTFDEHDFLRAKNQDLFIIDKSNTEHLKKGMQLVKQNMNILYEDNYALVLTKNKSSYQPKYDSVNIDDFNATEWYPREKNNINKTVYLQWNKNEWKGTLKSFNEPIDFAKLKNVVIEFNVNDIQDDETLRLIFTGVNGNKNDNVWDYDLFRKDLKKGHNIIKINKNEFALANGYIQWQYVNGIGFGGVMKMGTKVELINVKFEF